MGPDFSSMDKWYKAEFGDDGFNVQDFNDREYAGERMLFDINGRTDRFSASIGANWYYEDAGHIPRSLTAEEIARLNGNHRGSFDGQIFRFPSPKTDPLDLSKPLPPIPKFGEGKVTVQGVNEVALDKGMESPVSVRIGAAPFDYLFADADETELSTSDDEGDDSLSEMVEDDGAVVLEDVGPSTPPQVLHNHNAQPYGTNQVLDFTGIDMGSNSAAPLIVDEGYEAEKAQATDIFFNGPVEESPSPYHAPLLQGESGFGDIREGAEDCPEWSRHIERGLKTISCQEADVVAPVVFDDVPGVINTAPSSKASLSEIKHNKDLFGLADRAKARKAKQAAALAKVAVVEQPQVVIDLTVESNASETSSISKKRRARSSFATKSTFDDEYNNDDVLYLYTKKARVTSQKDDDEVFSVHRPSTYSLITQLDDDDAAVLDTIPNTGPLSQISDAEGFNGQFSGLPTSDQAERAKKVHVEKVAVYFGQALHLNNLILHKDMHSCPTFDTTEYTPASAPTGSDIGRCISYANERTIEAADMARTPAEDALRQEAHRECATARLEGHVVGFYRYFQGHLTVEEYHERKMCICWQLCECSKMCTRFADLICPCADKLETNCR